MSELLGLSHEPSGANALVMAKAMPSSVSMQSKPPQGWFSWLYNNQFVSTALIILPLLTLKTSVCQRKNPFLLGLSGTMIHETENVFKFVTKWRHTLRKTEIHPCTKLLIPQQYQSMIPSSCLTFLCTAPCHWAIQQTCLCPWLLCFLPAYL